MSPSEFDLRAALRDGEGDGPDPDTVLNAARAGASARRTRIAAVSGTAVAVLAVGTAGALVLGHGGNGGSNADRDAAGGAAGSAVPDRPSRSGTTGSGFGPNESLSSAQAARTSAAGEARAAAACPTSFPSSLLPGGGGSGQFGSGDPLFPQPVSTVVVCGYGSDSETGPPGTLTLSGDTAQTLVESLETAATQRPSALCPDYRNADDHRYAFVGITSDGTTLRAVTTTVGGGPSCSVRVTNGTALRYAWSVPASLTTTLEAVRPG